MTETVYVVGTESFFNNYSGNASSYLANVSSFCSDSWDTNIERGNSNYSASFNAWGSSESDLPIPNSALGGCNFGGGGYVQCDELYQRRRDARDYLQSNWGRYSTPDVILVIDYYGGDDQENSSRWTFGVANGNGAGTSDKVCIADVYYQEQGYSRWVTGEYSNVGLAGTAWHEVLHMYSADHDESSIYQDGDSSIMYSYGAGVANCLNNGTPNERKDIVTTCVSDSVRNFIN